MAYIDDIVIATETVEDHLDRIREVFDCLREAGFKTDSYTHLRAHETSLHLVCRLLLEKKGSL